MKLYNANLSNFASKCRIAIYEKNLKIDIVELTPAQLQAPEYLKVNPLGKIPALDADGMLIPESETINEYLEEKFPSPALLPKSPEARARVRNFTRFHDIYLEPPLRALFPQVTAKTRDQKLIDEKLGEVKKQFDYLERILGDGGYAAGPEFTLADCALAPTIFFAVTLLPLFNASSPLEGRPKFAAWWTHVQTRPSVKKVLGEITQALIAYQQANR